MVDERLQRWAFGPLEVVCNDKTQSEVFFGAFDYIKRAYKAQASDSGAS